LLNDQDLSTYGIVQNLAWGGAVPVLADRLGWDAQAVVSRVREGEVPKAPTRVYRLSGQISQEGVLEFDEAIYAVLQDEGADQVAEACLKMLAEVLRREVEVRLGPVPEGSSSLDGSWVQTSVRVLVGENTYEVAQYVRPTDVGEVVAAFSTEDGAETPEVPQDVPPGSEELLTPDMLLGAGFEHEAPPEAAPAPAPQPAAPVSPAPAGWGVEETAAGAAPPVAFEVQQWPELPQERPQIAQPATLSILYDVPLMVRAELGRTQRRVEEIITLGPGSVIDLDRMVGDMVDIYANGQWVAKGEVVVVEENFGVRITEIGTASERVSKLRLREGS